MNALRHDPRAFGECLLALCGQEDPPLDAQAAAYALGAVAIAVLNATVGKAGIT